jgi:predicted amidohydrolase YtcJ
VKIMQDGVFENFTAAMIEPYLDASGVPTGGRGISFLEPAALDHAVTRLDEEGFQVHVHAIGDRAVREALDAFAAARRANGPSTNRHHIAHLQVVHPEDHPRFAELDVVATAQPLWAINEPQMTELTLPFLGAERAPLQYPWRTLQRHGARLAFGSDWPVTSADPLWGVHVAVNRTAPRGYADRATDWPPFFPEERLTLVDALTAYTAGAAFVNHLDRETGRLEVGYAADVAVVEPDPFDLDPSDLDTVSVRMTLVDGSIVYG